MWVRVSGFTVLPAVRGLTWRGGSERERCFTDLCSRAALREAPQHRGHGAFIAGRHPPTVGIVRLTTTVPPAMTAAAMLHEAVARQMSEASHPEQRCEQIFLCRYFAYDLT